MKTLKCEKCSTLDSRKRFMILCYMSIELGIWCFMTYSAICNGKIFDYKYTKTDDFVSHLEAGNWYYQLMFGLNLTHMEIERQQLIQGWSCHRFMVSQFCEIFYFSQVRHPKHAFRVCFWDLFHLDNILPNWNDGCRYFILTMPSYL